FAVECAELAGRASADAETILAANIEWQFRLQLSLAGFEKSDHAAQVVVVTVAQDQCIETCRVDLKNRQVVTQHFGRVAEIDQNMTVLVPASGFGVHGETPLAVKRAAWRPLGRKIAAGVAFNSEPIACFGWDELDHDIVGDHMHGKAVD